MSNTNYDEFLSKRLRELRTAVSEVSEEGEEPEESTSLLRRGVVDFSDEMYEGLRVPVKEAEAPKCEVEFPDWDVLKEVDRRIRRKARDKSKNQKIRDYMKEHPEEVERIRKEHGLE